MLPPPLIPSQVENGLRLVTVRLVGLPDDDQSTVRIGWQQQGQPAQSVSDNVVYVRAVEDDDAADKQRDQAYQDDPDDAAIVRELTSYMRVWRGIWTFYGPDSFDWARRVRSGWYTQVPHDVFATLNFELYAVMDIQAPRRAPELFQNEWWERVDLEIQFNELVTEEVDVGAVASTEVRAYTDESPDIDHPEMDIVVEAP